MSLRVELRITRIKALPKLVAEARCKIEVITSSSTQVLVSNLEATFPEKRRNGRSACAILGLSAYLEAVVL